MVVVRYDVGFTREAGTVMTPRLDEAFSRAAELPDEAQDELADIIVEMIESDTRWDAAFAASQDKLARLAEQVRGEIRNGKTEPLDLDGL